MISCITKCQQKLENNDNYNYINLYNLFIETWGCISINHFDHILKKFDLFSNNQNKFGEIPLEIYKFFNIIKIKYNFKIQTNAIYILLLYTLNKICLDDNLIEKYSYHFLLCFQYIRKNYTKTKTNCFQNIVVYQAFKFSNDIFINHFKINDSTINLEIENLKDCLFNRFWNGIYFKDDNKFSEKINAFAIMFNLLIKFQIIKLCNIKEKIYFLNNN